MTTKNTYRLNITIYTEIFHHVRDNEREVLFYQIPDFKIPNPLNLEHKIYLGRLNQNEDLIVKVEGILHYRNFSVAECKYLDEFPPENKNSERVERIIRECDFALKIFNPKKKVLYEG